MKYNKADRFWSIVSLVLWIIIGVIVFFSETVTKFTYFVTYALLMMHLVKQVVHE